MPKARGEHQHDHADLRKGGDGITGLHQIQHTGADDQTGKDLTHHLRGLALAGSQAKNLALRIIIAKSRKMEYIHVISLNLL